MKQSKSEVSDLSSFSLTRPLGQNKQVKSLEHPVRSDRHNSVPEALGASDTELCKLANADTPSLSGGGIDGRRDNADRTR